MHQLLNDHNKHQQLLETCNHNTVEKFMDIMGKLGHPKERLVYQNAVPIALGYSIKVQPQSFLLPTASFCFFVCSFFCGLVWCFLS